MGVLVEDAEIDREHRQYEHDEASPQQRRTDGLKWHGSFSLSCSGRSDHDSVPLPLFQHCT
jgi:hypothetical protein